MATTEAASVDAFEILARELAAYDAPSSLVRAAKRAAHDEERHAQVMTKLARKYAADVSHPVIEHPRVRPLEEIARENAIVACVEETYAAAVADWQAEHATDPDIARAMTSIARDEARHAHLGWQVHAWLRTRLSSDQRAELDAVLTAALAELTHAPFDSNLSAEDRSLAGLPSATESAALAQALVAELQG